MAPLDDLSAPGTATYDSDTMTVGDGTWDFTKNTFLLPNLEGLNFETMHYNGMGNRFSTFTQYHVLIKAHGIMAVIIFLFLVPAAIFSARFFTRRPGYAIRYHAYLQVLSVLLLIAVFITGYMAVGPSRSLTNPHHGIGVAIFTLFLVQIVGGRLIKNIRGRSLKVMLHQWFGRTIALLGIAQVPLGLTLYGSPKYTFILYAIWMAFLLFLYFVYSYRVYDRPDHVIRDGRSEFTHSERTERKSSKGGVGWLGPFAAVAALWALLRGRKKDKANSRSGSRSRSRASRVRSRSRSRAPEVIPSRRESFIEEEKYSDRYSERPRSRKRESNGGFMDKFVGVGAGLGAGALIARMMGRRNRRTEDEEYSAIATDTPSRRRPSRSHRRYSGTAITDYSDESEEYHRNGRMTPLLPGPGGAPAMAAAISAAEARQGISKPARPVTPQQSHRRADSRIESTLDSDYSSYVSPSRRDQREGRDNGAVGKGLLGGLGLAWFAKKMKGRDSRRPSIRPAGPGRTMTSATHISEESSLIEPRPLSGYDAGLNPPTQHYQPQPPSAPVLPPAGQYAPQYPAEQASMPSIVPVPVGDASHSRTQSKHSVVEPATMPEMPPDPQGILARESESDSLKSRRDRRRSASRQRAGAEAAAAAAASASMLAAEEAAQRRVEEDRGMARGRTPPVAVKVKVHDDKDRNVTLRRLTEDEARAARRARRRRADSASSLSGSEVASGSRSRYRRDSSRRRAAEETAESAVEPLSPPAPAFAGGRRPKDSAYYSGPGVGPSGIAPAAGATVSSLGGLNSHGSHGTWSEMSPGSPGASQVPAMPGQSEASTGISPAERSRRRRMERRTRGPAASGTVDFN